MSQKLDPRPVHLKPAILMSFLLIANTAWARSLSEIGQLAEGPPTILGEKLGDQSYVQVQTYRLTRARVAWVNWDLLAEMGFDVGDRKLTPQFERLILDAVAFGVPGPNEPASAFDMNKFKIFLADRYGGNGLGINLGSGRAASAGSIQSKGLGQTDLVAEKGESHADGTMAMQESIREAIYGEVARDLPRSSNRVLFIIDRGTQQKRPDGTYERNSMSIRVDPVRPAHYVKNIFGQGPLMETDQARLDEALTFLTKALPLSKKDKRLPVAEQIRVGVLNFADNVAEQYAAAFARRLFHGATSLSNIEIDGRFLDYGTQTVVPDYGKFKILSHIDAFGDTRGIRDDLVVKFLQDLRSHLPKNRASQLPDDSELRTVFDAKFEIYHNREMLLLTGLNKKKVLQIENERESLILANLLDQVATAGAKEVKDPQTTTRLTKFDLNKILISLAQAPSVEQAPLEELLKNHMPETNDVKLRTELAQAYSAVITRLTPNERSEMRAYALMRNDPGEAAYRWNLWPKSVKAVDDYTRTGRRSFIANLIDSTTKAYHGARLKYTCRRIHTP